MDFDGPIYEFGSRQVAGQAEFVNLRQFFPGKEYVGCDYIDWPGVDCVQDIMKLDIPAGAARLCILAEIVEHVADPFKAMAEVFRILKPGGAVILTTQFAFPIHGFPYDYFRYTPQGMRALLGAFGAVMVGSQGSELSPHTCFAIGVKSMMTPPILAKFLKLAKDCETLELYERGRFGTLISRFYSVKARLINQILEWKEYGDARFII